MHLPITSLIPTIIEITSFIQTNWPHVWWYPHWYLGVPLRFITGPVIPFLLITLDSLLLFMNMTQIYILIIILIWFIGGVGVKKLIQSLGGEQMTQNWAFAYFIFLPLPIILFFSGSNGLHFIAINLAIWCFYLFQRLLSKGDKWIILVLTLLVTLNFLVSISGFLPIVVGFVILSLLQDKKLWVRNLLQAIAIVFTGVVFATVWYTPRFWWVLLSSPSFGGKPLLQVIKFIIQLLQSLIPIIIGVWVVRSRNFLSTTLSRFTVLFTSSFLFLSVIRFLSDIDFWQDWIGYGLELQFGTSILLAIFTAKLTLKYYSKKYYISLINTLIITIIFLVVLGPSLFLFRSNNDYKEDISSQFELLNQERIVESRKRVFLSGSPVFWLSSEIEEPLTQVRGGSDAVATHKTWAMGAFQVREGESQELLENWLQIFGVSFVLVHDGSSSREYYKDYKNVERFIGVKNVYADKGDEILDYGYGTARIVSNQIMDVSLPEGGDDVEVVREYTDTFGKEVELTRLNPTKMLVVTSGELTKKQVISISQTYDRGWKAKGAKLKKDSFSNIVVIPDERNQGEHVITYKTDVLFSMMTLCVGFVFLAISVNVSSLSGKFERRLPSLGIESRDEEVEY